MPASVIARTPSADPFPLQIGHLLDAGVRAAPDQLIVYADRHRMTYRDLSERVHRLASVLAAHGVEAGDTVAVMDWDSHRYLECFFAVPMMGAVLHTVNIRLSPEQILYTINHAEDAAILVNSEFLPLLAQIWERVSGVRTLMVLDDEGRVPQSPLPVAGEYEALLAAADSDFEFPALEEDARATTFYTTGTTGLPKGVYFSHRQLVLHTLGARTALAGTGEGRFNADDVYMPITPMFHVHAWGLPYIATTLGVKQVYPGRYQPDVLLRLIASEGVTFSHCVPTILQMLLGSPQARQTDLSRWKVIIGGSAMSQALAENALALGIDAFSGYGMSETCPILTLAQLLPHMQEWAPERQIAVRCKSGRPVAMVQLRLVDGEMHDVPRDGTTPGEVVVRAPWLTQGYLKDPENSEALWRGGWLHTGDIGVIDGDGYLKVTDRIKDVIKSGGEWISSLALEDLILHQPGVVEAVVIGVPDSTWGERPLALVVKQPDAEIDEAAIRDSLRREAEAGVISQYAVPERVLFVESIPKTSVGKVNKRAIREEYVGASGSG